VSSCGSTAFNVYSPHRERSRQTRNDPHRELQPPVGHARAPADNPSHRGVALQVLYLKGKL
jgi:hypothetical protein